MRPRLTHKRRAVCSAWNFCDVHASGFANGSGASDVSRVRPRLSRGLDGLGLLSCKQLWPCGSPQCIQCARGAAPLMRAVCEVWGFGGVYSNGNANNNYAAGVDAVRSRNARSVVVGVSVSEVDMEILLIIMHRIISMCGPA